MPCTFDFSTNFDHQLFPQGQMADLMNVNINLYYLLVKLYYQHPMSLLINMKKLAGLVRELEDLLSACTRCGMCQAVCPLYRETAQESSVARGKLAILGGLLEEAFKEPRRSLEQISRCLLCGACEANCPSGVRVLDIF